jgi:DNA polymerase I
MTTYTRTCDGHTMTVHAPPTGAFDPATRAAFEAFTGAEAILGLDVETSAIEDRGPRQFAAGFTVRLVQFGTETDAWVLDPTDPAQRQAIEATLSDPARRFVTHTPYDVLAVWSVFGIALGQRVIDAHLLSKLIDPDERAGHGLKDLTARHLDNGLTTARDALYGRMRALAPVGHRAGNTWKTWGWNHLPTTDETYAVYAGLDAIYVRRLLPILLEVCAPFAHLVPMEAWLAAQSVGITIRGLLLDRPYTLTLLTDLQAEHRHAETRIKDALGCLGGSPRLAAWLDEQTTRTGITGLPRTDTGRLQVTTDTLTALLRDHSDELPAAVVELATARLAMARTSNLIGNLKAFLDAADDHDRVHPQINTLRAKTARMSITGPALQTLKKHDPRLRHCFRADPGYVLISCDFAQVEVRVAAGLSGDPTLTGVITSGVDIHNATAALMYGDGYTDEQRTISKRATFGTLFGGGARALAAQTGVTEQVARQVTARWRDTYPRVITYTKSLESLATVVTASGRHIPADRARPYANGNYMIQSTARDLLLAAVYRLVTRHHITGLWLFVHDEVIVQAPAADAERVRDALQDAMTSTFRGVPILADAKILGTHWGELPDTTPAPARALQIAGTSGTSGVPAGQPTVSRFRAVEAVPELPELPESAPTRPPHPLAIALACAGRGWRVFPIRPRSKKPPAITDWETRATGDPDRIRRFNGWRDGTHNVGIATGPSGLVVLDLDSPKPGQSPPAAWARPGITTGEDVLADLCETHGEPYPTGTFTVRTGRGGTHLYFELPAGSSDLRNTNGAAGRGLGWLIDVRGGGGYVVAPGCVVDLDGCDGSYTVTDASNPRPLPEWLTGLLKPAHDVSAPLECIPSVVGRVSDLDAYVKAALKGETERVREAMTGGRNHALNKAAYNLGRLIAAGALPEPIATAELYTAASSHFASDPPLTADDARPTIGAGIAAGKRSPRQVHGREAA